jgi:valyl-tRNA synthetase
MHSPGYEQIKDLIKQELKLSKDSMHEEGYVEVLWSWLDDMDDFLISKKAWQGILTLDVLKNIKAYA